MFKLATILISSPVLGLGPFAHAQGITPSGFFSSSPASIQYPFDATATCELTTYTTTSIQYPYDATATCQLTTECRCCCCSPGSGPGTDFECSTQTSYPLRASSSTQYDGIFSTVHTLSTSTIIQAPSTAVVVISEMVADGVTAIVTVSPTADVVPTSTWTVSYSTEDAVGATPTETSTAGEDSEDEESGAAGGRFVQREMLWLSVLLGLGIVLALAI